MVLTYKLWKAADNSPNFFNGDRNSAGPLAPGDSRMGLFAAVVSKSATWPITVGAEGIAAAQFARCGFDVLVQAGRDKPWYDLVVTRTGSLLKVSVKASDDGEWRLTNGYARNDQVTSSAPFDCRSAIERWLASHGSRTVSCLVQFNGAAIDEMPRIYLALPGEVAQTMRQTADRIGRCVVRESYEWTSADGSMAIETLPASWLFSPRRIEELLAPDAGRLATAFGAGKNAAAPAPTLALVPKIVLH